MKVYRPQEIANVLKVKDATLRKYSLLLEKAGYEFQKNDRGQRWYTDKDVIALRKLIALRDNGGMTLEEAADGVYLWSTDDDVSETHTDMSDDETVKEALQNEDIAEIKDLVRKQTELISKLTDRIDEQQATFSKYVQNVEKERQEQRQLLLEVAEERSKAVAEKEKAEEAIKESKKAGFFGRLFKKDD